MDLHLELNRAGGQAAAQLAAGLRDAVRSGRLAAGTRLPPSRTLAADIGVSRGPVVEAYEQLVAEGFLISRQGAGTWVADVARRAAAPAGAPAPASGPTNGRPPIEYNLMPGTPDLADFPRGQWLAALRHALATLPHHRLGYADPGGLPELRAELAGYLRRVRAADAAPDDVVVVAGVAQGMSLGVRAVVDSGRRLLAVEDPTSLRSRSLLLATGAQLVPVPVDAEGVDVAALRRTPARAVLLTPAHQYPTGAVLSARRRAALLGWAADVDAIVLEDDYDAEFRYDRDPVGCLQGLAPGCTALIGSTSKSLAPGLRLGWIVAPPALAHAVRLGRAHDDLGSPVLDQAALARLITSGAYDRHLRRMRRRYRTRRDALVEALNRWLPAARVHGISAGLHLLIELPPACDEAAVVALAAARGVAVEPVASMRATAGGPPALVLGYARLSDHHLARAVRLLAEAVHGA
ncbi:MAG TPA: PLP-dependent aminotransferase family protein [Pseudonocardiaceae bacterium]